MQLTRRELWLATGLGAFAIAWATFAFCVSPALERIKTLNRVIPKTQSELELLGAKVAEFSALRDGIEGLRTQIASQEETFELLPFVDSLVKECGLSQKLVTMVPETSQLGSDYVETVVAIEIERVTRLELYDFLLKLQSAKVMANTKQLHINKNLTDASLLHAEVDISNLKLSPNRPINSS
ncbi:MAG: hypothetical protein ACYS0H_21015, partial [Planctomycetota bacterium]